jgi:MFS family permease
VTEEPSETAGRRWPVLVVVNLTAFIITFDLTVVNVAMPAILRDFDADLGQVQWLITGYALTFASFLIVGGRLGDTYGHRRTFVVGAGLVVVGASTAAAAPAVAWLVVGRALLEGSGAAMMQPATLAILSNTFTGRRERAMAFGAWGTVAGISGAIGPAVGGFLTTNASWRWCFLITAATAAVALVGAATVIPPSPGPTRRAQLDLPCAIAIALAVFLVVFGISQAGRLGWWRPLRDLRFGGLVILPRSSPISGTVVAFASAVILLWAIHPVERRRARRGDDVLLDLGLLRHRTFRRALLTISLTSLGHLSVIFLLPVFLQGRGQSAQTSGLWQLPAGVFTFIGAQVGVRIGRVLDATRAVQFGSVCATCGFAYIAVVVSPEMSFLQLLPGLVLYGVGIGSAATQITNIALVEIEPDSSGVASAVASTARQVGFAIGVATAGAIMTAQTVGRTVNSIGASGLAAEVKGPALAAVRSDGVGFIASSGLGETDRAVVHRLFVDGMVTGVRAALLFAVVALVGATIAAGRLPATRRRGEPGGPELV